MKALPRMIHNVEISEPEWNSSIQKWGQALNWVKAKVSEKKHFEETDWVLRSKGAFHQKLFVAKAFCVNWILSS